MFRACLLAAAVCMDTFFAAMGCSMSGITVPKRCAALISLVGTVFLGASLLMAQLIGQLFPAEVFRWVGAGILLVLGSLQVMKEGLTALFRAHPPHIRWKTLGLVVEICFDETCADADGSKTLSLRESAAFSAALSLDSLASGLGAGIALPHLPLCLGLTLLLGFVLTVAGCRLGRHCRSRATWVGGVMLIGLGVLRFTTA